MIEKAPGIGFRCVTQIPLIFFWPGQLPQGLTSGELAESIDCFDPEHQAVVRDLQQKLYAWLVRTTRSCLTSPAVMQSRS